MGGTVREDDDWMSTALNQQYSLQLATEFNCSTAAAAANDSASGGLRTAECMQGVPLATLYSKGKQLRFAPALAVEGDYPLGA